MRKALAGLLLAAACSSTPEPPPSDPFDGNVVVGDASELDAAPAEDARPPPDAGPPRDAQPPRDATFFPDAMPPRDAGVRDAAPDAGDPCAPLAVAVVTASAAVSRLAELEGRVVDVEGMLGPAERTCTDRTCPSDMPCCNTCSAAVAIDGIVRLEASACYAGPGCSGDTCVLVCTPPAIGIPQRVRGVLMAPARPGDLPARLAIMAVLP